ncbi:MAG: response regulator [Patescibacteria group bacterium]
MSKILIVIEEDLFLGNIINEKVKKEGYETLYINNGAVAIDQMKLFKPEVVILDMELLSVNALKVLREKKENPEISGIPIIIISPSGDAEEIRNVLDLGVRDYIVKSQFNAEEVITKIKSVLSISERKTRENNLLVDKKIMWVEDDKFLSDLIARKLTQQKCKLLFSRTGEEALELLKKEKPDLILLDLLLPGISGFEVLEYIKKDPGLKDIPVIVLSNFTQNNEMEKTKILGADRFLTKATVVLDDIVREIQMILLNKQAASRA